MASNKSFTFGPVALTTTLTTNILNCNVTSVAGPVGFTMTQPYLILRYIYILNKTGTAATFSLYLGATGANTAGTEFIGIGTVVQPNSLFPWGGAQRMDSTQFLVGGSGTTLSLVIWGNGEIGVSG